MKKGIKIGFGSVSLVLATALFANNKYQFINHRPATENLIGVETQVRAIELARNGAKRVQTVLWNNPDDEVVRLTEIGIGLIFIGGLMVGRSKTVARSRRAAREKLQEVDKRMADEKEKLRKWYVEELGKLFDRTKVAKTLDECEKIDDDFEKISDELRKQSKELSEYFLKEDNRFLNYLDDKSEDLGGRPAMHRSTRY